MTSINERIIAHPKFAELTRKRNRFSLVLLVSVLAVYYAFIFTAALAPDVLGAPLAQGMTLSIGLPLGFAFMVLCFLSTGLYVRRANSEFDALNRTLVEECSR